MSAFLLQCFLGAFGYGMVAIAMAWSLERLGLLRDGALAETLWRIALYAGLGIALVHAVKPLAAEWAADLDLRSQPMPQVAMPQAVAEGSRTPIPRPAPAATSSSQNLPVTTSAEPWSWRERDALLFAVGLTVLLVLTLSTTALALRRRQRYLRHAMAGSRQAPAHWHAHVAALAGEDVRPLLRSAGDIDSPLCGDGGLILLPDWAEALDGDAQRALLAHELAHLRRRDPLWRLLDAIAVALMLGLPPFRYAARRLEVLAEFACDADAARRTRAPQALAECIAHCLERQFAAAPRLTVAMAAPDASVVDRVQRLIEERPMFTSDRITLRRSLIAVAIVGAFALPAIAISVAAEHHGASIHIESSDSGLFGARMTARFNEAGRALTLKTVGKVGFNEREDDVAHIDDDGSLSIKDTHDGVTRTLMVEVVDGKLLRDYRVDGDAQAFDASAKQWLAATLPEIFRRTGLDAEARAKRILARAGVEGLLAETALVTSDYPRAAYVAALFTLGQPDRVQTARAIALAREISSDYELRRALSAILEHGALDELTSAALLEASTDIESDYERAELLIAAAAVMPLDGARLDVWQQATRGVASDYDRRRVLESLLAQHALRPEHARLAIALAADIGSDYEKRMLLATAAETGLGTAITRSEYTRVAATIGSDYERREALLTLIRGVEIDAPLALDVLNAARDIGSDYEAKEVLTALARVMPADADVQAAYRSVARGLATYERGEAEQALDRFAGS